MSADRFHSIRFRLTAGGVVALVVLFVLVNLFTFEVLHDFAFEVTESDIGQTNATLMFEVEHRTAEERIDTLSVYFNRVVSAEGSRVLYAALIDQHGTVVAASDGAPDPLPAADTNPLSRPDHDVVHIEIPVVHAGAQSGGPLDRAFGAGQPSFVQS